MMEKLDRLESMPEDRYCDECEEYDLVGYKAVIASLGGRREVTMRELGKIAEQYQHPRLLHYGLSDEQIMNTLGLTVHVATTVRDYIRELGLFGGIAGYIRDFFAKRSG